MWEFVASPEFLTGFFCGMVAFIILAGVLLRWAIPTSSEYEYEDEDLEYGRKHSRVGAPGDYREGS